MLALYGTTGALEAARRALNVVFETEGSRSFLRRKSIDIGLTFGLMTLILVALIMLFVGGGFAEDLFGFIGLGYDRRARSGAWSAGPARSLVTMLIFAILYYVSPDVEHRSFRWVTPGAALGVLIWLGGLGRLLLSTSPRSPTSAPSTAPSPARSSSSPGFG